MLVSRKTGLPCALVVESVGLVDPSLVPNDLVVEAICSGDQEPVHLELLRSGDWVVKSQRGKKTKHRDEIRYMPLTD